MTSIAIILVPHEKTRDDVAAAVHRHAKGVEIADALSEQPHKAVEDAEQLPLWRWFTF